MLRLEAGRKAMPTIVFHGSADRTVHPSNADRIIAAARDWAEAVSRAEADLDRVPVLGVAHELGARDVAAVGRAAQLACHGPVLVVMHPLPRQRRAPAVRACLAVAGELPQALAQQTPLEVGGHERRQEAGHGRLFERR